MLAGRPGLLWPVQNLLTWPPPLLLYLQAINFQAERASLKFGLDEFLMFWSRSVKETEKFLSFTSKSKSLKENISSSCSPSDLYERLHSCDSGWLIRGSAGCSGSRQPQSRTPWPRCPRRVRHPSPCNTQWGIVSNGWSGWANCRNAHKPT